MTVQISDIQAAKSRLSTIVKHTPLMPSLSLSERFGSEILLKYENLQLTGSFKIRGAFNKIAMLNDDERKRGIIASSAGNHAQGVAWAANKLGVKAHIVMPVNSPLVKVAATEALGAEVILFGDFYDQAFEHAKRIERENGYIFVHPYLDPTVIAGQGTIGLEILNDHANIDTIVVAVGGGGLASGIATAVKALKPDCRVYGVQASNMSGMVQKYKKLQISDQPRASIADGIAVKNPSQEMYDQYLSRLLDDMVTVSEEEIASAIVHLVEKEKTVVEGAGAAPLAAVLKERIKLGRHSCVILSGGNIDTNIIADVIQRGLMSRGRLAHFSLVVADMPGTLSRISQIFGSHRANILQVNHDRFHPGLDIKETRMDFLVETKSFDQIDELYKALALPGIRLL